MSHCCIWRELHQYVDPKVQYLYLTFQKSVIQQCDINIFWLLYDFPEKCNTTMWHKIPSGCYMTFQKSVIQQRDIKCLLVVIWQPETFYVTLLYYTFLKNHVLPEDILCHIVVLHFSEKS
jgi:hypothetical protein